MRKFDLGTKTFGKSAKQQVRSIVGQAYKCKKHAIHGSVMYKIVNIDGVMIGHVNEGSFNNPKASLHLIN